MSLKHAILVLLTEEPGSGYDLVQRFKSGIGHFWNASHQQVYHELKKLHGEELVSFAIEPQQDRPDRKVYRITDEGKRSLKDWYRQPVNPPRSNNALLVKVYGCDDDNRAAVLAELEHHLRQHQQRLAHYGELEQFYFSTDERDRHEQRAPYLTLRLGIRYERHWIDWLEETLELLADGRLPASPLVQPPPEDAAQPALAPKKAIRKKRVKT